MRSTPHAHPSPGARLSGGTHRLLVTHWLPLLRCTAQPRSADPDRGAATAEYAMGVVAAVLAAALLLQFVLAGLFDDLLRSALERALGVVVAMATPAVAGVSVPGVAAGAWSTLSSAADGSVGRGWGALVDGVRDMASGAVSATRSAWSGASQVAAPLLDTVGMGLRWAGGPISGFLR